MDKTFDKLPGADRPIAYVRPVRVADLPAEIRAEAANAKELYAVHSENGERLALVDGRQLAFVLAKANDLAPVSVH